MNTRQLIAATAALSLGLGNVAFAQGRDTHSHGSAHSQSRAHGHDQRHDRHDRRIDRHDRHDRYQRHDPHDRRDHYRGPIARGAGPNHSFYRGGRLPPQYRSRQYVVDDWRGHRLSAPPRGYHWVQTGGDYVLVAVATGIIASILLNQ